MVFFIEGAVILELTYLQIETRNEMLVLEEVHACVDNPLQLVVSRDLQNQAAAVLRGN